MLDKILPTPIDNRYRGHRLALWLLGALITMKGGIGAATMFNGRSAAIEADGIPLDTFTPAGEQAFVALFAAWGLSQLVINLIGLLVLVRYRALVCFMFVVLLVEHLARMAIFRVLPIPRSESPPGLYVNLAFLAVMIIGLFLALPRSGGDRAEV